jgi:predicted unusual protein kinase regulating ubiquinone biosynthesis (AarF/ABC1/UbiB family)
MPVNINSNSNINSIFNGLQNAFSNIGFMFNVLFIFLYEYIAFLYAGDYSIMIRNIATKLSHKNVLYVKVFQAISLNNNLIDDVINAELIKFTDAAPYTYDDIDEDLLHCVCRHFYLTSYTNIIPMKSGMISLVYKMRTAEDEDVIIKMKRKNIDEKLDDAIEKLMFFINILSLIPQFNILDISNVVKKNIQLLRQQLNFDEEVKNTIEMAENYKRLKYIKVPTVYQEATIKFNDVIMMEYIEGIHISKLNDDDYNEFAKLVMKYGFASIINNSSTHGDLHAGNIIFIKNDDEGEVEEKTKTKTKPKYQLGLIDFGIVTRINERTTKTFLETVTRMFTDSGRVVAEIILDNIIEPTEVFKSIKLEHREKLYIEASKIIDETVHNSKDASQVKVYDFIKKFNQYINNNNLHRYGLYISDDFVKLQMALAMSQGVSLCLCKNDFIPFANTVLNEMFHIDLLQPLSESDE